MEMEAIEEALARGPSQEAYEEVLELAMGELFAERACLLLKYKELELFVYQGDESLKEQFPFSREIIKNVLHEGRGLVNYEGEEMPESTSIKAYGLRSVLCAPLEKAGFPLGVLYFDNRASTGSFKDEDVEFVRALAAKIAGGVSLSG